MRTLAYIIVFTLLVLLGFRLLAHNAIILPLEVLFTVSGVVVIAALWLTAGRKTRGARRDSASPPTEELDLRNINLMLQRMQERIESLETILLDREARVKRAAEHD